MTAFLLCVLINVFVFWLGYAAGRASRNTEVYGLKLQARFCEHLAVTNAEITDKVIREINKRGRP